MSAQPLTPDLLASVAALEKEAFPHPWSERSLALLCGPTAFGFACLEGERVVAYGGILTVLDEGQITNIATHPDHRRHGAASAVLRSLIAFVKEHGGRFLHLEVRASNSAAIALYEQFGFSVDGIRKNYYKNSDAILMMKELIVDE